jgi:hypothetical protein
LKRLLREAYRLNDNNLMNIAGENKIKLCLLLSLSLKGYRNNKMLKLSQIEDDMKILLNSEVLRLYKL